MLYGIRDGVAPGTNSSRGSISEGRRQSVPEGLLERNAQEAGAGLRAPPRAEGAAARRAAHRPRPGRHARHEGIDSRACADGAAILLSSHLLFLVEELCSRLLIVHDGRLVASGTMEEIRGQAGGGGTRLMSSRRISEITEATPRVQWGVDRSAVWFYGRRSPRFGEQKSSSGRERPVYFAGMVAVLRVPVLRVRAIHAKARRTPGLPSLRGECLSRDVAGVPGDRSLGLPLVDEHNRSSSRAQQAPGTVPITSSTREPAR